MEYVECYHLIKCYHLINGTKDWRQKEMNMKRRWRGIALCGMVMATCFTAGVYAQDAIEQVQAYLRSDYKVIVNGQNVNLANSPLIYNNNSYLPVKELAGYLGAIVNWKADTKTIYINSKINPEQPVASNITYDEFNLTYAYAYYMTYLGGEYPMLTTTTDKMYYREKDLLRMGIDTNGLRKAKDNYTEEIYISEDEAKKRWKETPGYSYTSYSIIITGEKDIDKLKALKDYTDSIKPYTSNNVVYFRTSIIIDALPQENEYEYLYTENNHFYRTKLTLTKWTSDGEYLVGSSSTEDIQAGKTVTQTP
jgi:hypothetical protein